MRRWLFGSSDSGTDGVVQSTPSPSGASPEPAHAAVQCRQEQTNIPTSTQSPLSSHKQTKTDPNRKVMEVPYDELRSHLQKTTQELETARREFMYERCTMQNTLREAQAALAQSHSDVASLRQQLQQEVATRADDRRLLEARTQELQHAQAYLTMVDTVSVAETLSMVRNLNSDIFQTAATIAEETFSEHYELSNKAMERAERWLGTDIAHLLYKSRDRNAESRTLVMQTVVQFALTEACSHITQFWDAALESTSLGIAYNQIRTSSSRSVSARWRVLTRGNLKYIDPAIVEKAALARLMYVLSIVLVVSGWTGGASANWDTYGHAVKPKFQPALERIVKDIVALDRAMGEGLMSVDAELVTIIGGEMFDESFMENGFEGNGHRVGANSDGGKSALNVACTTDLGLRAGGREGRDGGTQLLLKPKVVLWSALLDAPHTDAEQR